MSEEVMQTVRLKSREKEIHRKFGQKHTHTHNML